MLIFFTPTFLFVYILYKVYYAVCMSMKLLYSKMDTYYTLSLSSCSKQRFVLFNMKSFAVKLLTVAISVLVLVRSTFSLLMRFWTEAFPDYFFLDFDHRLYASIDAVSNVRQIYRIAYFQNWMHGIHFIDGTRRGTTGYDISKNKRGIWVRCNLSLSTQ